jgi:hypothetical protein
LWTINAINRIVHEFDKFAVLVKHMYATIAPVGNQNIIVLVDRATSWSIELAAVQYAVHSKAELKLPVHIEYFDAVIVKVCDDQVPIRQDINMMRTGKVFVLIAQHAETFEKSEAGIEYAYRIRFTIANNDLVQLCVRVNAYAFRAHKLVVAEFLEIFAIQTEYVHTFEVIVGDKQTIRVEYGYAYMFIEN